MNKFLATVLVLIGFVQYATAMEADTRNWASNPNHISVSASELDLKSDLKNDYRIFQTTVTNLTNQTLDVEIPSNANANDAVNKILNNGLSIKELLGLPKQIAVDSYNEDVGEGKIAQAHKGLIYVLASAGAVAAGAGLVGVYPQQKVEEYFSHKKIKKEYKKFGNSLIGDFTLAPLEQKDLLILVPITSTSGIIQTTSRDDQSDVYTDYHQL